MTETIATYRPAVSDSKATNGNPSIELITQRIAERVLRENNHSLSDIGQIPPDCEQKMRAEIIEMRIKELRGKLVLMV